MNDENPVVNQKHKHHYSLRGYDLCMNMEYKRKGWMGWAIGLLPNYDRNLGFIFK